MEIREGGHLHLLEKVEVDSLEGGDLLIIIIDVIMPKVILDVEAKEIDIKENLA